MTYRKIAGVLQPTNKYTYATTGVKSPTLQDRNNHEFTMPKAKDSRDFSWIKLKDIVTGERSPRICLIRRIGGLGDVLMVTPICEAIKQQLGDSTYIIFGCDTAYAGGQIVDLLQHIPNIDEILPYQKALQLDNVDLVEDFTGICVKREVKGFNLNRIDIFANYMNIKLSNKCPKYIITEEETKWAKQLIKTKVFPAKNQRTVGIVLRSQGSRRTWPLANIIEFVNLCKAKNIIVVPLDAKDPSDFNGFPSNLAKISGLTFCQSIALAKELDLTVAIDSGIMHGLGAVGAPTLALFGSVPPESRTNYYPTIEAFTLPSTLPCQYCYYSYCPNNEICIKMITAQTVLNRVVEILNGSPIVNIMNKEKKIVYAKNTIESILI